MKKVCLFLVFVLLLTGCGTAGEKSNGSNASAQSADSLGEPAVKEVFAMDTYMTLTAYGDSAQDAVDAAAEEIDRIEKLVSTGEEDSEISVINREGLGTISGDTEELIQQSLKLYKETEGLFDITIYPVMRAWGFTDEDFRVPEDEELQELLSHMGSDKISVDSKEQTVSVKEGTEIDLGGIAKGYTSARVMEIFKDYGVTSGVVSLGGNVQALGTKPDGSEWRVAVENPDKEEDFIGILSVDDKAVITSGGYERYFEEDGKTYHHIIDPRTGYPAENGLTSVTIVSDDGMQADGLSTSLFIMGKEKAVSFWREHSQEFEMILVDDEGNVSVSEGIAEHFESENEIEVVERDMSNEQ